MKVWYTRTEALSVLGVRPQTLYAYASRGRIRVSHDPTNPRRSLYSREDIDGLLKRRDRGRRPQSIAASTIAWGEPIIDTSISTIAQGRLFYRGRDAIILSEHATLEDAAALLWEENEPVSFGGGGFSPSSTAQPLRTAIEALAEIGADSHPIFGRAPAALRVEAARLVGILSLALGAKSDPTEPLHRRFGLSWNRGDVATDLIRRALVLLADQELTTSAFAARVVASSGATLASCVLAGLAALSGPLHGGATLRVRSLFEEVARTGTQATIANYLARGLSMPGFGHALYPSGDPRAAALLHSFEPPDLVKVMIAEVFEATGLHPTIDVALEALSARFDLPPDAAFTLFAVARSVGWLAHCIEQNQYGTLIRPRARYTGETGLA
jgi:citrate synthase